MSAESGDLGQALAYFRKDIAIAEQLASDDPTNATAQRDVMVSHYKLGGLLYEQSEYAKAARHFSAGIEVLDRMIADGMLVAQSKIERETLVERMRTMKYVFTRDVA